MTADNVSKWSSPQWLSAMSEQASVYAEIRLAHASAYTRAKLHMAQLLGAIARGKDGEGLRDGAQVTMQVSQGRCLVILDDGREFEGEQQDHGFRIRVGGHIALTRVPAGVEDALSPYADALLWLPEGSLLAARGEASNVVFSLVAVSPRSWGRARVLVVRSWLMLSMMPLEGVVEDLRREFGDGAWPAR